MTVDFGSCISLLNFNKLSTTCDRRFRTAVNYAGNVGIPINMAAISALWNTLNILLIHSWDGRLY